MRSEKLAVDAEFDEREFAGLTPDEATKHLVNLLRHKADEVAAATVPPSTVHTDRIPMIQMTKGTHVLTGQTMVLVHSVWDVDVAERVAATLPGPEVVL